MKKILWIASCFFIIVIPKYGVCQGIWDAWDKSASSVDHNAIEKAVKDAMNASNTISKRGTTYSDWKAEREEQERRNRLNNTSNLLNCIDDPDDRSMILYESEYRERLKSELLSSNSILDYYGSDEGIRKLIISEPLLQKKVKDKIFEQKDRILYLAENPNILDFILSDSFLKEYYNLEKEAKEKERKEQLRRFYQAQDRELKERAEKARQIENQRIQDETNRAQGQMEKNNSERDKNNKLKDEQLSSPMFSQLSNQASLTISEPKIMFGIRYHDDLTEDDYFDELLGDNATIHKEQNELAQKTEEPEYDIPKEDSYIKTKVDLALYNTKDELYKLNKKWEASKGKISTVVKEVPNKAEKKTVSVLVKRTKGKMKNLIGTMYPGYEAGFEMWGKGKEITVIGKEEKGFVKDVIQCISKDAVDAVASGDIQQLEECVTRSKDAFVNQMHSHVESFSHVKYRKFWKWMNKGLITNDEE